MVEYLPSTCEALGLIPCTTKNKDKFLRYGQLDTFGNVLKDEFGPGAGSCQLGR
jgi:hypothetical protein